MDWQASNAIEALRSLLGDGEADKWEFMTPVFPTPDGVTTRFFVGQTRVVEDTLQVYLAGQYIDADEVQWREGTFELAAPPGKQDALVASFYYQWFTDAELAVFLDDAAAMLSLYDAQTSGFVTWMTSGAPPGSVDIELGIRPSLLQFAAYNAYMRKAAESADSLSAGAPGGYSIDTGKRHPNWAGLAKAAMESGNAKLKLYTENPLTTTKVRVTAIAYALPRYQPL